MSAQLRVVASLRFVTAVALMLGAPAAVAEQNSWKWRVPSPEREPRGKALAGTEDGQQRAWARAKTFPPAGSPTAPPVANEAGRLRSRPHAGPAHGRSLEYQFPPGKTFAYVFLLQTTRSGLQEYIAGFAVFKVEENLGGTARLAACDNLRRAYDLAAIEPALPRRARMIEAKLELHGDGKEPLVDGGLPYLLGRPSDWFFPPLPASVGEWRRDGYAVERPNLFTAPPAWDRRNRGFFQWGVRIANSTPPLVTLRDSRSLLAEDRSTELSGSGEIVFDRSEGLMARRVFRGTLMSRGETAQIVLTIERLSEQQLSELRNR